MLKFCILSGIIKLALYLSDKIKLLEVMTTQLQITEMTKDELNILISQLEEGMITLIAQGDDEKIEKLNNLIGQVIDLYQSK